MTLLGAFVARMLNTCSIGRRWKSREGWSRPVLTGERGTLFPTLVGRVSSCGGFLVGWQGTLFLVVTTTILVRRLICLRPLSGSRTATIGIGRVAGSVAGRRFFRLAVHSGFAVVMAQVRRPVPFRTRKLRPGTAMVLHSRGCGRVARRRIQLSGPSGRVPLGDSRKVFFYSHGVFSSGRWGTIDVGKPVRGRIPPVGGGFRTVEGLWTYWLFQ